MGSQRLDSSAKKQASNLGDNLSNIGGITGNDWNKDGGIMESRIDTGNDNRPAANGTLLMESDQPMEQ